MESVAAALGQGESLARSSQPVNYAPGMKCSLNNDGKPFLNSELYSFIFVLINSCFIEFVAEWVKNSLEIYKFHTIRFRDFSLPENSHFCLPIVSIIVFFRSQ